MFFPREPGLARPPPGCSALPLTGAIGPGCPPITLPLPASSPCPRLCPQCRGLVQLPPPALGGGGLAGCPPRGRDLIRAPGGPFSGHSALCTCGGGAPTPGWGGGSRCLPPCCRVRAAAELHLEQKWDWGQGWRGRQAAHGGHVLGVGGRHRPGDFSPLPQLARSTSAWPGTSSSPEPGNPCPTGWVCWESVYAHLWGCALAGPREGWGSAHRSRVQAQRPCSSDGPAGAVRLERGTGRLGSLRSRL